MNISTLIQFLENKKIGLEGKEKMALAKGNFQLIEAFHREYVDTAVTLELVIRCVAQVEYYETKELNHKFKKYVLENLPSLALYFKESSIHAVLEQAMDEAFKEITKDIKNKIIVLTGWDDGGKSEYIREEKPKFEVRRLPEVP